MSAGKLAAGPSFAIPRNPSGSIEASDDVPSTSTSLRYLALPQISVEELMRLLGGAEQSECQVIDVRQPLEFRQSHIAGAINKHREQFTDQPQGIVEDFAKAGKRTIVLYCHSGQRASLCAAKLSQHIQESHSALSLEVKVLSGGFAEWIKGCQDGRLPRSLPKSLPGRATDGRRSGVMEAANQERNRYVEQAPRATVSLKTAIMQENRRPIGRGKWRFCGRVLQCGWSGHRFY